MLRSRGQLATALAHRVLCGTGAMTRRGMLAAAMAVAAACASTAVGESTASAAPVDAPHHLPGVSDMELKQVHVVFR
jgi:hypothetical protein